MPTVNIEADRLRKFVAGLFRAAGVSERGSATMGEALVDAELAGLPSHGVLQGEAYLKRIRGGSITTGDRATVVSDREASVVLDANFMLGHLSGDHAMEIAIERAKRYGAGIVAVRRGMHFGMASRFANAATEAGCVGVAMGNSRSVMPAPGGAEPLVGTNPLGVSLPTADGPPIALDMATSEGTVGRVRVAQRTGKQLPANWAVKIDGAPTTDPTEALAGMLLPTGGAKGFGLSLIIDLLAGLLSGGVWGPHVKGLHGDPATHTELAQLFMAIDIGHFQPLDQFKKSASQAAERVRKSKRAPGVERLYTPGERKWATAGASGGVVKMEQAQIESLNKMAGELGAPTLAV